MTSRERLQGEPPTIEEARAIKKARTKAQIAIVNHWRLRLLSKEHSGFTEEENRRRFDLVPGWKEECERRCHENLTDEERADLEAFTAVVAEYNAWKYPWPPRGSNIADLIATH